MQHLPQDSWTQTAIRDERFAELANPEPADEPGEQKFGPWALLNYQIATLTDAVNRLYYVTATDKRIKPETPEPPPVPRPGPKRVQAQPHNPEAVVLYLDRLRARG